MEFKQVGAAAGLGVAAQVADFYNSPMLINNAVYLTWGTPVAAVGLVVGALLQSLAPMTEPEIADGLVDAGAFYVAHFITHYAMIAAGLKHPAGWIAGGTPVTLGSTASARGSLGGFGGVPKVELV